VFKNKPIIIALIAEAINKGAPFLLIPILTQVMSPEEYGILSYLMISVPFIIIFISFGTLGSIPVFIHKYNNIFHSYFKSLLVFLFLVAFLMALVLGGYSYLVKNEIFLYISLITASTLIFQIDVFLLQAERRFNLLLIKQIVFSSVSIASTYFLLPFFSSAPLFARLNAWLLALLVSIPLFFVFHSKLLSSLKEIKFETKYIKQALIFGLPLIIHQISAWLLTSADRFFVGNLLGHEQLGIYSLAVQLAIAINVYAVALNRYFQPTTFKILSDSSEPFKAVIKLSTKFFVLLVVGALLFIAVIYIIFPYIVDDSFIDARNLFPFIAIGFLFNGLYLASANILYFYEKTYFLSKVTLAVVLIYLPLSYFLTSVFGIIGTIIAMCSSWFILFVISLLFSRKILKDSFYNESHI